VRATLAVLGALMAPVFSDEAQAANVYSTDMGNGAVYQYVQGDGGAVTPLSRYRDGDSACG
jgi:hypothetical protein